MLGHVSFVVSVLGALPYLWSIFSGSVKPERTTWGIWTLILLLSVVSYHAEGASDSLWFLLGDLVITGLIFVASLWRGKGGYDRLDIACVVIALLGLFVWMVTNNPLAQLIGVMTADVIAMIPTVAKAIQFPYEESYIMYAASSCAAVIGLFAVGHWDGVLIAYPLYLYTANLIVAIVIYTVQKVSNNKGAV